MSLAQKRRGGARIFRSGTGPTPISAQSINVFRLKQFDAIESLVFHEESEVASASLAAAMWEFESCICGHSETQNGQANLLLPFSKKKRHAVKKKKTQAFDKEHTWNYHVKIPSVSKLICWVFCGDFFGVGGWSIFRSGIDLVFGFDKKTEGWQLAVDSWQRWRKSSKVVVVSFLVVEGWSRSIFGDGLATEKMKW
ncbi:Uncharacterized protein Fot_17802 [Forsythia ovata]|uniref:Uncharacterized protein n=1 Tax=Forsythia ovata TaxID=205694 RepID=A0ABD1VGE2_9LAMI